VTNKYASNLSNSVKEKKDEKPSFLRGLREGENWVLEGGIIKIFLSKRRRGVDLCRPSRGRRGGGTSESAISFPFDCPKRRSVKGKKLLLGNSVCQPASASSAGEGEEKEGVIIHPMLDWGGEEKKEIAQGGIAAQGASEGRHTTVGIGEKKGGKSTPYFGC